MRNLSVATKIYAILALAVLFSAGAILFLLHRLGAVMERYDRILATEVREQDEARVMQVRFKKQVQEWKNILLRGHAEKDLKKYRQEFFAEEAAVRQLAEQLQGQIADPAVRDQLREFIAAHEKAGKAYRAGLDVFVRTPKGEPRRDDAIERFVRGIDRAPTDMIDGIVEALGRHVDEVRAAQHAAVMHERWVIGGLAAVLLAGVSALSMVIARGITRPLTQTVTVLEAVASGDLTRQMDYVARDEVGRLAAALNHAVRQLREAAENRERLQKVALEQAERAAEQERARAEQERRQAEAERQQRERERHEADELRAKVDSLLATVDAAAAGDLTRDVEVRGDDAIGRVGTGLAQFLTALGGNVAQIAQSASTLASSSEELSAVSTQLSAGAEETSAQAGVVSAASAQVSKNIQTTAAGVEELSSSIKEIARNASEAAQVAAEAVQAVRLTDASVAKLGESSAEIGKVIKVITGIAEQTNLLALNATIEAARAGEAGKGFAVVANEVKELAKETAKATEDIGRKIAAIRQDTKGAVEAIQQIGTVINRVSGISESIASAVEEQTATTNEISRNVAEAAKGSGEIAQNITAVAQATASTTEGAGNTQKAAAELSRMAAELQQLVGQFRYERREGKESAGRFAPTGGGTNRLERRARPHGHTKAAAR